MNYCTLCGRELSVADDPLSSDCGGDCWGCIGMIEANAGWEPSVGYIREEIEEGWRTEDGTAKPQTFFLADPEWQQKISNGYAPAFAHPLSRCRACGFDHFPDFPWGENGKLASFDICECCGIQYGYDDDGTAESCYKVRKYWVENEQCAFWSPNRQPPDNWSPSQQLRWIPAGFRVQDDERLIALAAEYERIGLHLKKKSKLP